MTPKAVSNDSERRLRFRERLLDLRSELLDLKLDVLHALDVIIQFHNVQCCVRCPNSDGAPRKGAEGCAEKGRKKTNASIRNHATTAGAAQVNVLPFGLTAGKEGDLE